jgi:DoxX-like family
MMWTDEGRQPMKVLLWIAQAGLAVLAFAGGLYKIVSFSEIANMPQVAAVPRSAWSALGVFEMACAILLIAPAALKRMPALTPLAAGALAVESLALAALYTRYSVVLAATNPLVWVIAMAVMALFVAYGRRVVRQPT